MSACTREMDGHSCDQLRITLRDLLFVHCETLQSCFDCCADDCQASSTEAGIAAEFHVAKEVSILGISMFVLGLGLGPLVVGPLSELYGRIIVYRYSYLFFFLFSFPIAFAPNIGECHTLSSDATVACTH